MLKKLKQFLGLGQGDTSTIPESIANAVNSDNITPTNTLTIKPTGKDAVKVKK